MVFFRCLSFLIGEIKAPFTPTIGHSGIDQSNFDPIDEETTVEKFKGDKNIFKSF